jgi:dipeptidyl aminopeptidase/acylaminoacyl peptidase
MAGSVDLWSHYNGVYGSGEPYTAIGEAHQYYMKGPWYDNWNAIIQNSALYHVKKIRTPLLIVHGNQDDAVPFNQAVEMFNAMRRLGDRPVVLLEYAGEDHISVEQGATKRDVDGRILQFFGHFLKGEPAPAWWTEGVSRTQGTVPPVGR